MKLAAITDEISMDFAHALDVMSEYGCAAAELRGMWDTNITDLPNDKLDEVRRILDQKHFPVCCIASPLYKCDMPGIASSGTGRMHHASARGYEDQMDLLKHCADLTRMFGTKYVRIFAFWRISDLTTELEEAIAAALADGVKFAEDNGLVLLMENEDDCALAGGVETAKFLARINSPALRAVWDPGNAFLAGETPFPEGYNALRNYVEHVHVKDAEVLAGGKSRFTVVGEGEVDYKGQFAALKADGYSGYISLETHCRPFAVTAEQASRLCLQALNKLMAE